MDVFHKLNAWWQKVQREGLIEVKIVNTLFDSLSCSKQQSGSSNRENGVPVNFRTQNLVFIWGSPSEH